MSSPVEGYYTLNLRTLDSQSVFDSQKLTKKAADSGSMAKLKDLALQMYANVLIIIIDYFSLCVIYNPSSFKTF